jgi:hypothetical protein
MKRTAMILAWLAGFAMTGSGVAQDMPALGLGGFYETRIDNQVADEDLAFDYYGARLQFRDARWFTVFADVGAQSVEWDDYDADASGFFGIGGTFWMLRAEDLMIPLDIGIYGSVHHGDLEIDVPGGSSIDATYTKTVGQAVIRAAGYGTVMPFIRAGVMKSNMDIDGDGGGGDWDVTNPAINAGVELALEDRFSLTLEGNYSEGVGFGVRADLWF